MALDLPLGNRTLCVGHQNDIFLNAHGCHFLISGIMVILDAESLMNSFISKQGQNSPVLGHIMPKKMGSFKGDPDTKE
jgi:hypothetical protein